VRTFLIVWAGQTVSLLGSGLTAFALGVWVYLETGSVTRFALINFSAALPTLLVSPFAGALVDRWDRRRTLIVSDLVAGLSSAALFVLLRLDSLELWHIYLLVGLASVCNAFQWPAFTASTTLLVPPRQFSRAAAMSQTGFAVSQVTGPALGGMLLVTAGLDWVIAIDFLTFLVAVGTLVAVRIPAPEPVEPEEDDDGSLLGEVRRGWRYVKDRRGLMGLLLLFAVSNFSIGMLQALLPPLMLSFTTPAVLGSVLSVAGFGMVLGTLVMSVWSGPGRRVSGIFGAVFLQGVICLLGAFRPNVWLVGGAVFAFLFAMPVAVACSQAIWQSKIPPALQGRVFAIRRVVALSAAPVAYAVAGPLADRVFEPAMAPGGALAPTLGRLLGTGEGRGVAVLFVLLGILILLSGTIALSSRRVRDVERELPDAMRCGAGPGEDPVSPDPGPLSTSGS
jgi:MFS transporter, DHA3 family, macrolide efflux protein